MTLIKKEKSKTPSRNPEGRPKSAEKRVAIMDAAECHFLEAGYAGTSMDTIANTALVSKITIYSHFADKDALFNAVILRKCEQYDVPQDYLHLSDLPIREATEEIGIHLVNLVFSAEAIKLHRTIEAESSRDRTSAKLYYEAGPMRIKSAFQAVLEVWVNQKKLSIPDYKLACDQFFSLMKGESYEMALLNLEKAWSLSSIKKRVKSGVQLFLNSYGHI